MNDPRQGAVPARRRRVEVNGVGLAVTDHAPGRTDLPALVLVHATGFCGGAWEPLVPSLSGRFRVISYDQRGHGESDKPRHGYAWSAFAADLASLLAALDLEEATLVGHSKGGAAVAGAAAEAARPGRIARAVLLDPVIVSPETAVLRGPHPLAEAARRRRMVWQDREAMFRSLAARRPFSAWRPEFLRAYVEHGTEVLADGRAAVRCPGAVEAQVYEEAARSPSAHWLPRIAVPVLLVSGGESTTLPPAAARAAAALVADVRAVVLPGVGHFVPMEAPERVAELVHRFCDDTGLSPSRGPR